jgi:hypothetical protein
VLRSTRPRAQACISHLAALFIFQDKTLHRCLRRNGTQHLSPYTILINSELPAPVTASGKAAAMIMLTFNINARPHRNS